MGKVAAQVKIFSFKDAVRSCAAKFKATDDGETNTLTSLAGLVMHNAG